MLTLPPLPSIRDEIWARIGRLGPAEVTTYGAVARSLGDVAASKAVAVELRRQHFDPRGGCPCERVVKADGRPGRFAHGDSVEQLRRLAAAGAQVDGDRVKTLRELAVRDVLKPLRDWQDAVGAFGWEGPSVDGVPTQVAAVDVSYARRGAREVAVAAAVLCDLNPSAEPLAIAYGEAVDPFPYISGYLAFRELPALLAAWSSLTDLTAVPPLILVDGSGQLHPRRAGLASCLAAIVGVPTVGITKRHLAGTVGPVDARGLRPIEVDGKIDGYELTSRPTAGRGQRLDVSPGFGVDVEDAARTVAASLGSHRLPEPIYWADRLSRSRARSIGDESDVGLGR